MSNTISIPYYLGVIILLLCLNLLSSPTFITFLSWSVDKYEISDSKNLYIEQGDSYIISDKSDSSSIQKSAEHNILYADVDNEILWGALNTRSPPPKPSIRLKTSEHSDGNNRRKRLGYGAYILLLLLIYRNVYIKYLGGKGDKLHLGGFTDSDIEGISHNVWNFMMVRKQFYSYSDFYKNMFLVRDHLQ